MRIVNVIFSLDALILIHTLYENNCTVHTLKGAYLT